MVRLLLIFTAVFFSFQSYGAECGLFRVVKGDVTYQKKNKSKFRKAKVNKKVCAGDKIKTEDASRTKIVMADGNELNISPNTELLIEQYERDLAKNEKKVLLNVLYGKIRSNVKDKYKDTKDNHYRVKTKSAVAGVRGTEFMASFSRATNQSRVVTFEGKVAVGKFQNGRFVASVTVKPGQFTSNSPGTKPHAPRKVPPKEFAQLNKETNFDSSSSDNRDVANDAKPGSAKKDDKKNDKKKDRPKKQPKKNRPKNDKDAKNDGPKNDSGQADVDSGDASGAPAPGDGPDQFGDKNDPANDGGAQPEFGDQPKNDFDGSRDPASADEMGGLLPEPELPPSKDYAGGGPNLPKPPRALPSDGCMGGCIPVIPPSVNNAIQNRKSTITVIPTIDGQPIQ